MSEGVRDIQTGGQNGLAMLINTDFHKSAKDMELIEDRLLAVEIAASPFYMDAIPKHFCI